MCVYEGVRRPPASENSTFDRCLPGNSQKSDPPDTDNHQEVTEVEKFEVVKEVEEVQVTEGVICESEKILTKKNPS